MIPGEVQLLQQAGQAFLQILASIITEAVFYGLYMILFSVAVYTLWNRGLNSRSTLLPFMALNTVFLAYTLDLTAWIAFNVRLIRECLVENPDQPLTMRCDLNEPSLLAWENVTSWLTGSNKGILFWVGDAVVVWRACVIFPYHTKVKCALVCSLLCGVALAIASLILNDTVVAPIISGASLSAVLQTTTSVIFILVNAAATGFIAQKTYEHRKLLKAGLGRSQSKSTKIMILLVESGMIYCCIQIIGLFLISFDLSAFSVEDWVYSIWHQFTTFASAIYLVAVILLANYQRSIMDTPGMTEAMSNAGANIVFAEAPPAGNPINSQFTGTERDESQRDCGTEVLTLERKESPDLEMGERLVRSCP